MSEPKHPKAFWIEEVLKTDNTEDDSENPKEKSLKDISNKQRNL